MLTREGGWDRQQELRSVCTCFWASGYSLTVARESWYSLLQRGSLGLSHLASSIQSKGALWPFLFLLLLWCHSEQPAGPWLCALWPKTTTDCSLASYQGEEGDQAITKAIAAPSSFVLKPQREGGGRWCPLRRAAQWRGLQEVTSADLHLLWPQFQAPGDTGGTDTGSPPWTVSQETLWSCAVEYRRVWGKHDDLHITETPKHHGMWLTSTGGCGQV